jgi:hypothetical protein
MHHIALPGGFKLNDNPTPAILLRHCKGESKNPVLLGLLGKGNSGAEGTEQRTFALAFSLAT